MKEIYLDHAATTYLDPRAKEAMEPYWEGDFGNPSSLYLAGRKAKDALDNSRATIATILNCGPEELTFTGGGTEAINLGIFGIARQYGKISGHTGARGHLITSKIEHHAVLHSMEALVKEGFEITYLDVDEYGLVDPADVKKALRPDTILVSIMYANNEIGAIEPIKEIAKVIREYRKEKGGLEIGSEANVFASDGQSPGIRRGGEFWKLEIPGKTPFFLVDACQAAGALDLDIQKLGVDLLAFNGSKIYGPKGVGCLYTRRGIRLKPLIYGGGQENNLRSGTENVPGIVGLVKALEIADKEKAAENSRLTELRDYFIKRLITEIPKVVLNGPPPEGEARPILLGGPPPLEASADAKALADKTARQGHPERRLPNNINVSVLDIEGEAVILYLDSYGIYISTGSACTSTTLDPSHVILAIGRPYEYAHGSLRFTLGRRTTKEDLDYVMEVFPGIVAKLRAISPVRMEIGQDKISHPEAFVGQNAKVKVGGKNYK